MVTTDSGWMGTTDSVFLIQIAVGWSTLCVVDTDRGYDTDSGCTGGRVSRCDITLFRTIMSAYIT